MRKVSLLLCVTIGTDINITDIVLIHIIEQVYLPLKQNQYANIEWSRSVIQNHFLFYSIFFYTYFVSNNSVFSKIIFSNSFPIPTINKETNQIMKIIHQIYGTTLIF